MVFDPSYANNELNKDYLVKLKQADFETANKVYEDYYRSLVDKIDQDYYLFEFTDKELQEIIAKPDEWGYFDYELAKKILAERGLSVSVQQAQELKKERLLELSQPENEKIDSIFWGYIVCLLFFPIGLFMGWNWAYTKKTLPDGRRVFVYNEKTRTHGARIFFIAMALAVCLLISIVMPRMS